MARWLSDRFRARFVEIKPGPNATLWHRDQKASGTYRLQADVTHLDSGLHPHGAGLAFGGTDVAGEKQAYTYFLVRSDGKFLIKTRAGDETGFTEPPRRTFRKSEQLAFHLMPLVNVPVVGLLRADRLLGARRHYLAIIESRRLVPHLAREPPEHGLELAIVGAP